LPEAVFGAVEAPSTESANRNYSGVLRKLTLVMVAFTMAATLVAVEGGNQPVEAANEAGKISNTAANQLGKRYRLGATGMQRYDCSGLVYRIFERNGLLNRIGGGRKRAAGYYKWFRDRGMVTRSNPRKGDLVVWGRGKHIGVYIGNGRAISALTSGVSRHAVKGLNVGFTGYLRVKLSR
jgi:cell wall-associated NlpC family hydrolase